MAIVSILGFQLLTSFCILLVVTEHLKAATKEHLKTGHLDSGKSVSNKSPYLL